MEVIEVIEREVEVVEVIERGPQGPQGAGITTLTTQGDLLYRGATTGERLPIGTTGQILKVSSGGIPEWGAAAGSGVSSVSGTSPIVSSGGATPAISITAATTSSAGSMSASDKTKLDGIASGAEVNVNADWNASSGDAQILNKPTIPSTAADVGAVPTSRTISSGTGLTGGGDLTADRTLAVSYGTAAGTACQGNDGRIAYIGSGKIDQRDNYGTAGTINTSAQDGYGGSINTSDGGGDGNGGSINTSAHVSGSYGGSINTSAGLDSNGGGINTSAGGGSIDTRGTGSIQLGVSGTRTTLSGTATADRALALPDASGTVALTSNVPSASSTTPASLGTAAVGTGTTFARADHVHSAEVSDSAFRVSDNGDATKKVALECSSISTATTRTLTVPNANGTIARLEDFAAPPAIGSTTAAAITGTAGTFTTLVANNGTLTASAPVLDLSQTWNNAAVTFTGLRIDITNTTSATGSRFLDCVIGGNSAIRLARIGSANYALFSTADTGIGAISTSQASIMANGSVAFVVNSGSGGAYIRSDATFAWASGTNLIGASTDLILARDAADTLAQRRTTNPQVFNIYNTYSSATSYERGFLKWSSNVLQIGTEKGSSGGTARALEFQTDGVTRLSITANGANMDVSSVLRPSSGGTFALGGNARRWTHAFLTTSLFFGDSTSASDPQIKKNSTTLQVRLADDSGYTVIDAQLRSQGTAPATTGATGTAGDIRYDADYIYICTAASTWKRASIAAW